MADSGDGLNMGDMGEGRTKEVSKTSSLSKQVFCYDLRGRREPQPWFSALSQCILHILFLLHPIQRSKMNLTCVRGRGSQSGKPKSLVSVITLNSTRLIPQRPGQSFCRGLRESISEITSPIEKTANESLPTLCILEEQRSFHRRVSLSCPSMFWPELYSMFWIKRKLPGKTRAKTGKG